MSHPHIRRASAADLQAIVELHVQAFPDFMLTLLGRTFLRELYRAFMDPGDGLCFVALAGDPGMVVGVVAGTTRPKEFFRHLFRRRAWAFAYAAIPSLCRHPVKVGRRLVAAVFYRGESPPELSNAVLLSSLAVNPRAEGRGLGAGLVEAFCTASEDHGAGNVYLTTDQTANERVNAFYTRCGFKVLAQMQRADGRRMNLYYRALGGHS